MSADTSRIDQAKVDSVFLTDVVELLDKLLDEFVIVEAYRDIEREQTLYNAWLAAPDSAPKATNPANSAHVGANFPDGKARAVDVTLIRGGKDVWDTKDEGWQELLSAVKAHPRLHSLADIGDYDHIEKLHWQRDKVVQ